MKRLETTIAPLGLSATLRQPAAAKGLIVFAHGSGSSRLSPRNVAVAEVLGERGFATLLFDLLTEVEEGDRRNVFDIPLLADRLLDAVRWIEGESGLSELPLGLFGASTGAAAALVAASRLGTRIAAVVSRGGRPDLAGDFLRDVTAPTLLIVGEADREVLKLNEDAFAQLRCKKALRIVPGATHLFPEPGALETAIEFTAEWFGEHLAGVPKAD
ncbi:dienelactone hydrolase family protein [Aurantimonas sp. A3-2-R12]|uniref:dienelactone hydrolase family protein n=1 Tax=Aurantimonas sp. A3-2-R12 TaxID=3114362 RepID=UPI002E18EFAC|nr:alpha/beta family hydrolase [Aurantimonas sp. A3-2-R12]